MRATGRRADRPLGGGEAARIFTGAPVPAGADAVVRQEDTQAGDGVVRIFVTPELHENIRVHAMAARERLDSGSDDNDFFRRVADDPAFGLSMDELTDLSRPEDLVGRSAEQVERYLRDRVGPLLAGYSGAVAPLLRV